MKRFLLVLVLILLMTSASHAQFTPVTGQIPVPDFLSGLVDWANDVLNFWVGNFEWFVNWLQNIVAALYDAWNGNYDRLSNMFGVLGDLAQFVFQFTKPVIEFIIFILANLGEIIELAGIAVGILITLAGIIWGYLSQISVIVIGIFAGILGAPPVALPGLPRCITAPLESDICAVWYMFEYTVLADGTPGDFIIPLIVLGIDLIVVFYIIRSFIRVGKLFEGITSVG